MFTYFTNREIKFQQFRPLVESDSNNRKLKKEKEKKHPYVKL